jgi:hypothetical protein
MIDGVVVNSPLAEVCRARDLNRVITGVIWRKSTVGVIGHLQVL